MLELKVRPLTERQIEFLDRWSAEDKNNSPWPSKRTIVYARKFPCTRCGGEAYEFLRRSPASGLWHFTCFCWEPDCPAPPLKSASFIPWTGWKIGKGRYLPLALKIHACPNRIDIIVPCSIGGEVVWQRGIATFRTVIQGMAANPEVVRTLAWLQLKSISQSRDLEKPFPKDNQEATSISQRLKFT